MLAIGKTRGGGGYSYRYTAWTEEVDATAFTPESRCIYETQEEALQDIAETSAALRDNPTAEDAAERLDFLATLSNAVFLMRKEYPDQWEQMERDLKNLSIDFDGEPFESLRAELDKLSLE